MTHPRSSQQRAVDDFARGYTRSRFIPRAVVAGPVLKFFPPDGPLIEVRIVSPTWGYVVIARTAPGVYSVQPHVLENSITANVPLTFTEGQHEWVFNIGPGAPASAPMAFVTPEEFERRHDFFTPDRYGRYHVSTGD